MIGLQHIKHNAIDLKKWDETILNSAAPLVFAQSFYLNATSPGWEALVIGDYEAVFPLTIKSKLKIKYLPQPPFTSQLGAFGNINDAVVNSFVDYIDQNFNLIEIELNSTNKLNSGYANSKNTFVIEYKNGYEFNQNSKRNITKAESTGLKVEKISKRDVFSDADKYLIPFLSEELKISSDHINLFRNLLQNADAANQLLSLKVTDNLGKIKAIGFFISNSKHALFLKGTSFDKKENSGSMHLLMNYAIKYFANKSLVFDFGGGSNSTGLATFYKGLGGEKLEYVFFRKNKLPKIINLIKQKVKK